MALSVAHGSNYGWTHPEIERLLMLHEDFIEEHYIYPCWSFPKSNWTAQILFQYYEEGLSIFTWMKPTSFQLILDLMKNHRIFTNKSKYNQDMISSQLLIPFCKLAYDGNYVPSSG